MPTLRCMTSIVEDFRKYGENNWIYRYMEGPKAALLVPKISQNPFFKFVFLNFLLLIKLMVLYPSK